MPYSTWTWSVSVQTLYTTNLITGEVSSISFLESGTGEFGFDSYKKDTLIGFRLNGAQEEIISIDPTKGSTSIIATLDKYYISSSEAFAVDSDNHKAYLGDINAESFWEIYTTNLITGEVSSISFLESGTGGFGFDSYAALKLLVVIPGINDHGKEMIKGTKFIVNYDKKCTVGICENDRVRKCDEAATSTCHLVSPSENQIRQKIRDAVKIAKKKGKDVVVLIDMDLECYLLDYIIGDEWRASVRWAGSTANFVSNAFTKEAPGGIRILYAHSAGGDATFQSVYKAKGKRMYYDNINILNGRTNAGNLKRELKKSGYQWQQVKVFTNNGDCPYGPFSLSNPAEVKKTKFAGKAWVHLDSSDSSICPNPNDGICPCHSALRDSIPERTEVTFEVNFGSLRSQEIVTGKVDEMMLKSWSKP